MNIYAIGDVHGCYQEMMAMFEKLKKDGMDPKKDKLIFLGDYIDRGPDSKKVVKQLIRWRKLYPHWVFLYGNHEDIFRDWALHKAKQYGEGNWFYNGGKMTWISYGGHFGRVKKKWVESLQTKRDTFEAPKVPKFPKSHLDFLFKHCVYLHEEKDYVFVHAGLVPKASIKESANYPRTLIWARDGFIDSKHDWGKKVIFGHTADYNGKYYNPSNKWLNQGFMPIVKKNKIGIDTAVCPPGGKRLTAIKLPEEKFYFVEADPENKKKYHSVYVGRL